MISGRAATKASRRQLSGSAQAYHFALNSERLKLSPSSLNHAAQHQSRPILDGFHNMTPFRINFS
jgi:hypothetical protein